MPLQLARKKRRQTPEFRPSSHAIQSQTAKETQRVDNGGAYRQISFVPPKIPCHPQEHSIARRGTKFVVELSPIEIQDEDLDPRLRPGPHLARDQIIGVEIPMLQPRLHREGRHATGLAHCGATYAGFGGDERGEGPGSLDQPGYETQTVEDPQVTAGQRGERFDDRNTDATQGSQDAQLALRSARIEVAAREQETERAAATKVTGHAAEFLRDGEHRDAAATLRVRERRAVGPHRLEGDVPQVVTQHRAQSLCRDDLEFVVLGHGRMIVPRFKER